MIPRGRPVINEAGIAARAGVPLPTWRRRDAPAFREHVPSLLPGSRHLLYDLAQAEAYLTGKPIPALPAGEHPDDLLTAEEAAALLGITTATLRSYAAHGHLSPGTTLHGSRLWPRHEILDRRDNAPGRRPGEPQGPRKTHPYENDPRLTIAAQALTTAAPGTPKSHIAAHLAELHGHTPRTWERLLTTATTHRTSSEGQARL
ncbi:helix-turn-helix domain-containing protein [Streptomyces sp. bgisy095]|uniref:helix-turn-helix domain-containing protein n=1 Tax=unclassified Streptomyces TaxID=2593676 RepID=UPI003D71FC4B